MLQLILKETPIAIQQINKFVIAADWSSLQSKIHYVNITADFIRFNGEIIVPMNTTIEEENLDLIKKKFLNKSLKPSLLL